tara:strand:+ start:12875 stop:14710 length:1836 start_codon:yes stop_codon:yes gene_type:complete
MSNVNIQLGNLDFESIKSSIIEHLKTQNDIKDYDYNGSAAQVLLDMLAYNTLYYGYYANMTANEMFLDTAQKEQSIVSLVKPLGYVVPGKTSAKGLATVSSSDGANGSGYLIPRYTRFTGNSPNGIAYNFYTLEDGVLDSQGENTFTVVEGKALVKESPIVVDSVTNKSFLFGLDIDISTVRIEVYSTEQNTDGSDVGWEQWSQATNTQSGLNQTSKVYWLERSELGFFVVFGGGFDSSYEKIGKELTPNQQVRVSYLKSSGSVGNACGNFTIRDITYPPDGASTSSVSLTSSTPSNGLSNGGMDKPDLEAIRFFAPKWFASQNRAVTLDDCRGILAEAGFVTGSEDPYSVFNVWGGETMTPPRYGRLFVSLDTTTDPYASTTAMNILKEKTCVTIIPEFMNLETVNGVVSGECTYNPGETEYSQETLMGYVRQKLLETYSSRFELEKFDTSWISTTINSIDSSFGVSSDELSLKLRKPCPVTNGGIDTQHFRNICEESSLVTEFFTPSSYIKGEMGLDDGELIKLYSEGNLDSKGFQKLYVVNSIGDTIYSVGNWKPLTGEVNVTVNIFSDNSIDLEVKPGGIGSDKFEIKENMYFSNLIFEDFALVARN